MIDRRQRGDLKGQADQSREPSTFENLGRNASRAFSWEGVLPPEG